MSFGLLKELAAVVGGPEAIPKIHFDPDTTQVVLTLVLAKRDKRGVIQKPGEDDDAIIPYDMTPEAGEQILDWVAAHALDFFIRRFANSSKLFATQADQLAAVGSSLISSATSPGKTA
ncbi:hypothetical protein BGCPKDLD_4699 [Methylorubrum suomiense]|uniref:Tail assembly chaperone n=2 Tax=Methylorubrum suomiense TaxID=144191 RepID=A0ABQ4V162_9HYPH|nr:hypothetical protein BGCPKDLD_4699 [Methylorubrum suomiense]